MILELQPGQTISLLFTATRKLQKIEIIRQIILQIKLFDLE